MGGYSTPSTLNRGQAVVEYLLVMGLTVAVFGLLTPLLRAAIAYTSARFASGLAALN